MNLFQHIIAFVKRLFGIYDHIHRFRTDEEYERDKHLYPCTMNAPDPAGGFATMSILVHETNCEQLESRQVPGRRTDNTQHKIGSLNPYELLAYGRNNYPAAQEVRFAECCRERLQRYQR